MTFYSVLDVSPTSDEWVADYIEPVNKLISDHGGKYLARTSNHEQLEGDAHPAALRVIIEWPSKEAAMAFMSDEHYAPYLKARSDGSISHHYLIEGKDDLA